MSVNGIASNASLATELLLNPAKQAIAKKEFAGNAISSKYLATDRVEISAAAKAKVAASQTLLARTRGAEAGAGTAQETPGVLDRYGRGDVTELVSSWGAAEPGSEYDFNSDGRIDAQDLAELLTRLGQSKPESKPEESPVYTRADVERLREAWNNGSDPSRQVDARYDFDGDGRVNSSDLAELLSRLGGS